MWVQLEAGSREGSGGLDTQGEESEEEEEAQEDDDEEGGSVAREGHVRDKGEPRWKEARRQRRREARSETECVLGQLAKRGGRRKEEEGGGEEEEGEEQGGQDGVKGGKRRGKAAKQPPVSNKKARGAAAENIDMEGEDLVEAITFSDDDA